MSAIPVLAEIDYELSEELERRRRDGSLIHAKQLMLYEEIALPNLARIIGNESAPYAVRADLIKFAAKLVGEGIERTPLAAPAFSLAINLPGDVPGGPHVIIQATPMADIAPDGIETASEIFGDAEQILFDPLGFTPDYVPARFPLCPDLSLSEEVLARVP